MGFVKSHLEKMKLRPVEQWWSGKKVSQKCSTGQSFIFSKWLFFYKIHILIEKGSKSPNRKGK